MGGYVVQAPRKGTELDQVEKKIAAEGDEEEKKILKQLRKWDVDGDGSFSTEEVVAACKHFMHTKQTVSTMKTTLIVGALLTLAAFAALFGVVVASIEATKDLRPVSDGQLLTTSGKPVTVTQTVTYDDIFDMVPARTHTHTPPPPPPPPPRTTARCVNVLRLIYF